MKKLLLSLIAIGLLASCSNAKRDKIGEYFTNDGYKIQLVNCDGSVTHTWYSTGKVLSEETTDGYYFEDRETNQLVEVSGNLIISQNK